MIPDCIFCKIVKNELPSHKVWEDENYLAFLTIFPNTKGFTVVISKPHYPSAVFDLPENVFVGLTLAAKKVAKLLEERLEDVGRVALIYEGFGVDHAHAKLFPMHGTKISEWKAFHSEVNKYFEKYEGYVSSHDYKRADDTDLSSLAEQIRKNL